MVSKEFIGILASTVLLAGLGFGLFWAIAERNQELVCIAKHTGTPSQAIKECRQ